MIDTKPLISPQLIASRFKEDLVHYQNKRQALHVKLSSITLQLNTMEKPSLESVVIQLAKPIKKELGATLYQMVPSDGIWVKFFKKKQLLGALKFELRSHGSIAIKQKINKNQENYKLNPELYNTKEYLNSTFTEEYINIETLNFKKLAHFAAENTRFF